MIRAMSKAHNPGDQTVYHNRWFDVVARPFGEGDLYYCIRIPDYTCVVALTRDNRLVLVQDTLELPGGQVEVNETPEQNARKELLEEAGYEADEFHLLGSMSPDSGRLDNRMWFFLALDAHPTADLNYKPEAGIDLVLYNRSLSELMAHEYFLSSLHGTALFMALLKKQLPLPLHPA
jgi:8-oxo-dGTP pyrophosphatase MutT (NUDIX family)